MKITELISALEEKLHELGDETVLVRYSCPYGCCSTEDSPELTYEDNDFEPTGLYLN